MTNEESPRPWHANSTTGGHISDATGDSVCFCVGGSCGANAALIVDAVNERDRLSDIVRRLLPLAETTVENIRALGTARFPFLEQIKSDRLRGDINREVSNADYLLREARAALGAGENPTGEGVGV